MVLITRWPLLILAIYLTSCFFDSNNPRTVRIVKTGEGQIYALESNHGRILKDNPIILSKNKSLKGDVDLNTLLDPESVFITANSKLVASCGVATQSVEECYEVKDNLFAPYLKKNRGTWGFDANSSGFLQINTYAHIKLIVEDFHRKMTKAYQKAYSSDTGEAVYQTALPQDLLSSSYNPFWFGGDIETLLVLSGCKDHKNPAHYSPADNRICLGQSPLHPKVKFAQDPTVTYHEMGHAFIQVMLNLRNRAAGLEEQADLLYLVYHEAGSIGEGISDYFSYTMNKRTHLGEWAIGRFGQQSRPMSEIDPIHIPGTNKYPDTRLSYPSYILYDPNQPDKSIEDVHYAGQIISHYLVALTEDLQEKCQMKIDDAIDGVHHILLETLAELGSQTGRINDTTEASINLNTTYARDWMSATRPINYRNFAQSMAKYLHEIYANAELNNCNGGVYPKEAIETLLDSYGLLLFKTYNKDGSGHSSGHSGPLVKVDLANRKQSILIPKEFLILNPNAIQGHYYVFDNREVLLKILQKMQQVGQIGNLSPIIEGGLPYNNGNGKVSPGEFLGITVDLYNNSNTAMGGVQVLGLDWDQGKDGKPCPNFSDRWPSIDEGGADIEDETGTRPGRVQIYH